MKKFPVSALALCGTLACSPLRADVMMMGVGVSVVCGSWSKEPPVSYSRLFYESWVAGYLSGAASYGGDAVHEILRNAQWEGIAAWMTNYCAQHPLVRLREATDELVRALVPLAPPSRP
jgi:hypothetical protein